MAVPGAAERKTAPVPAPVPVLWYGSGISASALITARDWACFWGNRNNKPVLIVSRDSQGMSRRSVLAVPSCCRVTQLSNVVLCGQTWPCWVTVIGLLPVPRLCPRFELIACWTSFRSGYGRETCPSVEQLEPHLVIRHLPTGTSVLYLGRYPGTLPQLPWSPWSVGPALSRRFSPALSKLSPKTLSAIQQNRSSHASLLLHPLQQHLLRHPDQDNFRQPSPRSPAVKSSTQSTCSEEVCSHAIAFSLRMAQHANHLASQWECRSCRPRSSGLPRLRLLTLSSRLSQPLLLCIFVRFWSLLQLWRCEARTPTSARPLWLSDSR